MDESKVASISGSTPFLSIFNDDSTMPSEPAESIPGSQQAARRRKIKDRNTRQALLVNLPKDRAELEKAIASVETWWKITQRFHNNFAGSDRHSSFSQFADFAIKNEQPSVLALFLLCLALNGQKDEQMIVTAVSTLIVSDDDYAATMEGMECISLVAKYHADMGQPRKAWMCLRRGIMFAQLTGLHRLHSTAPRKHAMFWHFYEAGKSHGQGSF